MATQAQQNKDLVRRYCVHGIRQALRGNLGAVHDYLADHYVQHTASHTQHGRHGIDDHKASIEEAVKAIPDLCFAVDRYVAEGDYVVTHWRIEGTHTGRHKHRHSDDHLEGTDADVDIGGMTARHASPLEASPCHSGKVMG